MLPRTEERKVENAHDDRSHIELPRIVLREQSHNPVQNEGDQHEHQHAY